MIITKVIYHKKYFFFTIIYLTESSSKPIIIDLSVVEFFRFINKNIDDSFEFFANKNVIFI